MSNDFLGDLLALGKVAIYLGTLCIAFFAGALAIAWLTRLLPRATRARGGRIFRHVYFDLFNGAWRLALLGSAAVALSIASLWTTWGGLSKFTQHWLLAFLIGLGIQSVMLISAWLIGESFAAGLVRRRAGGRRAVETWVGMVLGMLLVAAAFWWLLEGFPADELQPADEFWRRVVIVASVLAFGLLVIGVLYCFRSSDLVRPYVQALGVMVKSAVLWVMFLSSMTASVFFSFDYHFNSIFTSKLRQESADSLARKEVPNVLSELGSAAKKQLERERDNLFVNEAWTNYERQLKNIREVANRIPEALRTQNSKEMQARQTRITVLEQRKATLTGEIARLTGRKDIFDAQLARAKERWPQAQSRVDAETAKVDELRAQVKTASLAAEQERLGAPGSERTGRAGAGPEYAKLMKTVKALEADLAAAELRLKGAKEQFDAVNASLTGAQDQLAIIVPKLAELKGEDSKTSQALRTETEDQKRAENTPDVRTAANALVVKIADFRQAPTAEVLKEVQSNCNVVKSAAVKVNDEEGGQIECDPKRVNEALAGFLERKSTIDKFVARCTNSEGLRRLEAREMVAFARTCVQESGIDSSRGEFLLGRLRTLEVSRDDEAQSFIVSLNAFRRDHNELAYLALIIAVMVDMLIFFAGVFGATTMTGPLEKAGLREIAARVRRLPPGDIRAAVNGLRDNRFDEAQLNDPRINQIVTLGLDRQVPGEPAGSHLVVKEADRGGSTYRLHLAYVDELMELMQKAQQRGEFAPMEAEPAAGSRGRPSTVPGSGDPDDDRKIHIFARPGRA